MSRVAGIGNIFNGDDGFGSEVARRLIAGPAADGVHIEDFGIRGVHLAYELLEGYDLLVLIDAMSHGEAPGTLFVFEPRCCGWWPSSAATSAGCSSSGASPPTSARASDFRPLGQDDRVS